MRYRWVSSSFYINIHLIRMSRCILQNSNWQKSFVRFVLLVFSLFKFRSLFLSVVIWNEKHLCGETLFNNRWRYRVMILQTTPTILKMRSKKYIFAFFPWRHLLWTILKYILHRAQRLSLLQSHIIIPRISNNLSSIYGLTFVDD